MSKVEERLAALGHKVPVPGAPIANFVNTVRTGNLVFTAGQGPRKVLGMVNCTPDFTDQPKVINGASDLLVAAFGDAGRHARSAVGMSSLPLGISVEIEMIVEVS